jgi:hypothetical protein
MYQRVSLAHPRRSSTARTQTQQLSLLRKENNFMKTNVKKILGGAALGLALVANATQTWAGTQYRPQVTVLRNYADGSMNGARYSADAKQYIGCYSAANPTYANAACYAMDRDGASLFCATYDPALIATVSSITDSSTIIFRVGALDECSDIQVINSSSYLR